MEAHRKRCAIPIAATILVSLCALSFTDIPKLIDYRAMLTGDTGNPSDRAFDYIVYGLRIGFEEISIVQEKNDESYIKSMAAHRERYNTNPEFRQYNALERFRRMNLEIG